MQQSILGVKIHSFTQAQIGLLLHRWIMSGESHMIVTPNPEILLQAARDPFYRDILNQADLALPDGAGVRWFGDFPERITGVDVATDLLTIADWKQLRVACVLRADGRSTADQLTTAIDQRVPGLECLVVPVNKSSQPDTETVKQLLTFDPQIMFVGLGFPEQEQWLAAMASQLPSLVIGMAVGGTFDFWTGVAVRAPDWFRRHHIEWLWRLAHEPRRLGRILRAILIFPIVATWDRLKR